VSDRRRDLMEPEGVNAGSGRDQMSGDDEDARPGGNPSRAAQSEAPTTDPTVVRPPWDEHDPDAPSLEQSREEGAH